MVRVLVIIVLLLPLAGRTQDGPAAGDPGSLSLSELCENRSDPVYWAEIQRRGDFRGRELRAIREQKPLTGITQEALVCFMGRPTYIYALVDEPGRDFVEAWVYELAENSFVIIHVRHRNDNSTVVRAYESDEIEIVAD